MAEDGTPDAISRPTALARGLKLGINPEAAILPFNPD